MFKLRAHHGLCIQHFVGKGYSQKFVKNMTETIEYLNRENPEIQLVAGADEICKACPNLIHGRCNSEEKVQKIDKGCLGFSELKENAVLRYCDYKRIVEHKIMKSEKGKTICKACQWYNLCY